MKKNPVVNLVLASLFLALCLVLPMLTGQIQGIGNKFLPMHIPVLLCGFICGWPYGLLVGAVAPVLRAFLFTMPPMYPVAVAMAFELAAYGFMTGILKRILPEKTAYLYLNLIISMLVGRAVWGVANYVIMKIAGSVFTWQLFATGAFANAVQGIVIQLILIPVIVIVADRHRVRQ